MTEVVEPHIITELYTNVALYPHQINNNIYVNLKQNLKDKLLGKCYRGYGLITDIYEIIKYDRGIIKPENLSGSVSFSITFSCRICSPIKNQTILCSVAKETDIGVLAVTDSIIVTITNDRISDYFMRHNMTNKIKYRDNNGDYINLNKGDVITVTIDTVSFDDGGNRIKILGVMKSVATEEQTKKFNDNNKLYK